MDSRPPAGAAPQGSADSDPHWSDARWAAILDRIEYRHADRGLKFWGPPLWLEVTMVGADSDLWPAYGRDSEPWNWQSSESCDEATALAQSGAADETLLMAVGRYTVSNLVLNAVHEVGEWFRFDGLRVFPAHPARSTGVCPDEQGNGSVMLTFTFAGPADQRSATAAHQGPGQARDQRRLRQLGEVADPGRFTYMPATAISFRADGPVVHRFPSGQAAAEWQSEWSAATVAGLDAGPAGGDLISAVQRDVHRAIVEEEADRICRALYVDGRRPWDFGPAGANGPGPSEGGGGPTVGGTLRFSIDYAS